MFCTKGLHAVKELWTKVTPTLEKIYDDVLVFIGVINKLEKNPAIELIVAAIPGAPAFQTAINAAINLITTDSVIISEGNTAQKLNLVLLEINKLAPSVQTTMIDRLGTLIVMELNAAESGTPLTDVEADTLTQLKKIVNAS